MISFGVAPAILALRVVMIILYDPALQFSTLAANIALQRVVWSVVAIYVACAALRLARFNVENEPDEAAHMSFKGLPSPGAAAAVSSLVLLWVWMKDNNPGAPPWIYFAPWCWFALAGALSFVTLACALLMVSRFRYPHLVNQFIRGKRPFGYLVKLVLVMIAALIFAIVALGRAGLLYHRLRLRRPRRLALPDMAKTDGHRACTQSLVSPPCFSSCNGCHSWTLRCCRCCCRSRRLPSSCCFLAV